MIFSVFEVEEIIGVTFKDKELLRLAFTHSSFANEKGLKSNERLEFLGDSFLGFVIANELYLLYPDINEGNLSKLKNELVSASSLSEIVIEKKLSEYELFSVGEAKNANNASIKMLANLFEAIVASIYLDSGEKKAKAFILKCFKNKLKDLSIKDIVARDYKSTLLEYVPKKKLGELKWVELARGGRDDNPTFQFAVEINGVRYGIGEGGSKKNAQSVAAKETLEILRNKFGE